MKASKVVQAKISVAATARRVMTCAVKRKKIRSDSGYVLTMEPRGRIKLASRLHLSSRVSGGRLVMK